MLDSQNCSGFLWGPHPLCVEARGELVDFSDALGKAVFVSHQWLTKKHPDPEFRQMRTLQDAVKRILNSSGSLSLDPATEAVVPTAKPRPMKDFQTTALFFWYDYFSCPQLHHASEYVVQKTNSRLQQANAISSIPAYVGRCHFFLAVCPVLDCPVESRVLSASTWSSRGWCRLERAARELSPSSTWIVVRSETSIEAVGTVLSFSERCRWGRRLCCPGGSAEAGPGDAEDPHEEAEPLPASGRPARIPAPTSTSRRCICGGLRLRQWPACYPAAKVVMMWCRSSCTKTV